MENSTRRIQRVCKALTIITNICCITLLISFCASVLFIFIRNSIQLSMEEFNMLLFNSVFVSIQSLVLFIIFSLTCRMFRDISKEYTPFLIKNVVRMKKISILTILWGIISPIAFLIIRRIIPIESTFTVSGIGRILVGVLIYCFFLFFEYACLLQQQSDETM